MRNWTEEQKQAIEAENGTLLICAAAGSGKTSVLVERIVRKLTRSENAVPPGSLLVVTFTNAAAAEMRARIYKRLGEETALSPQTGALRSLMARLDEMTVCTMDAFCMHLVKEHFSDCGVEPDFGMIEEGEEKALKTQIARSITDGLYQDDAQDFSNLTSLFSAGRDDAALCDGILALSDYSMSEAEPERWLEGVAAHFCPEDAKSSVWGEILTQYYLSCVDYCILLSDTALQELGAEDVLREKLEGIFSSENAALRSLRERIAVGDWDEIGQALCAAGKIGSITFPSIRGYTTDPVKVSVKAKRDEIKEALKKLRDLYPANAAEHAEDIAALRPAAEQLILAVKRFNDALFQAKKERNLYGFSDITHFAVELLFDPAAPDGKTPLARELSSGFSEILIDEYQDTNRVQDRLFTCLSQNGENMFLVGDIKQSIYRFRLASPELFSEKMDAFPVYDPAAPAKKAKIILSRNFRSRQGITDTVNFLFSSLMSRECGEIEYNEEEALVFGASYYPESLSPDTAVYLLDAAEKTGAAAEAAFVAELIESKIAAGLTVTEGDGVRPATYGDFCILLRSVRNSAALFADALRKKNIPVIYEGREDFFDAAEVKIALSFLRAVDNPMSDLDLLAVMLSPLGLFSPGEAAKLKNDCREQNEGRRQPLYMALILGREQGNAACSRFLGLLERFRMLSATASAAQLLETMYNETPVLAAVRAMEGGLLREANLRALYEAAVKFSSDGEKNLCSFLRYLDLLIENGATLRKGSAGADRNTVSILTMHRSKGLEYPFVIVAGLTKQLHREESAAGLSVSHRLGLGLKRREADKLKFYDTLSSRAVKLSQKNANLSEELRIYYVAFTRAKEKLFLVFSPSNPEKALAEAEMISSLGPRVPPYYLGSVTTPLQWFLPVLQRHPGCSVLRVRRNADLSVDFPVEAFRVRVLPAQDAPAVPVPAAPDEEIMRTLRERLERQYKYAPVSAALSLHTASKLREEKFSPVYFGRSMPAFMYDVSLSPADVGTATHKFLEACAFTESPDISAEIERLVSVSRLSKTEGQSVNVESLRAFFASSLYRRVLASEGVYRERSFTIAKSVRDFDPTVPEQFAGEKTVVIGQIDLVFIENGEAVIVDYKTDHIREISELPARYAGQLAIYGEAVEKALGYPVKEKLLYSLTLRQFTEC